jgi:uncharacterized protein YecE (DUF72 family)
MDSAEINGSFYSLQRPDRYRAWFDETPEDFVFAVKGGRFITHMKRLREVGTPLANFFASGVLALGHKLGPILWQLPPNLAFDRDRLAGFFALLPRTTSAVAAMAKGHDDKLKAPAYTKPGPRRAVRHALEVRHPSFSSPACVNLLRDNDIALVVSDSAGTWVALEEVTSDFVYVRLHGGEELYTSGYDDRALDTWAEKIRNWARDKDVYVYFDNDVKVRAPVDAIALAERLTTADA